VPQGRKTAKEKRLGLQCIGKGANVTEDERRNYLRKQLQKKPGGEEYKKREGVH